MTPDATISHGRVRGIERDGRLRFLGMPYAEPPVGLRRFLAPTAPTEWTGVLDASAPGDAAPQDPFVPQGFRASGPASEDCLSINVYTPGLDDARRPVLFWIHGGGFSHGASTQPHYDGGPLAVRGDVVVVSANYRLGSLGYLSLGGHGGDEWGAAVNAGQLDQIAALQWVRDNITAFGGNPDNVTIFGQSAGSFAVSALLAMPAAQGLFAKAIAQSGTANRLGNLDTAAAVTARFLDRLGIADPSHQALLAADVDEMLQAQGARGALAPIVDGDTLPIPPLASVRAGGAASIPLMIGTARDEHKLYVPADRPENDAAELERQVGAWLPSRAADRTAEVVEVYRGSRAARGLPCGDHDIVDAVATASRFRIPATRLAEAQQSHQPDTYLYQVDWTSPARGGTLGACHGIEIPFVFGTIGSTDDDRMTGSGPAADLLSQQMMDAWITFARTGNPAHDGIGDWPAYEPADRSTMIFGPECGAQSAPFEEERALWDALTRTPTNA